VLSLFTVSPLLFKPTIDLLHRRDGLSQFGIVGPMWLPNVVPPGLGSGGSGALSLELGQGTHTSEHATQPSPFFTLMRREAHQSIVHVSVSLAYLLVPCANDR
jgi:hypothetical protein